MRGLTKISPIARAVAVIGAVAGLTTAVTFANLTSNAVAFGPNDIQTASASLAIEESGCSSESADTLINGFQVTGLVPGGSSETLPFCLQNNSDVALNITGSIPQDLSASVAALYTKLNITCDGGIGVLEANLNSWGPGTFASPLGAGSSTNCVATVSLGSGYTGSGGESIPTFGVYFVGNQ